MRVEDVVKKGFKEDHLLSNVFEFQHRDRHKILPLTRVLKMTSITLFSGEKIVQVCGPRVSGPLKIPMIQRFGLSWSSAKPPSMWNICSNHDMVVNNHVERNPLKEK